MTPLGCFIVTLTHANGGKAAMVVIDSNADEARRTVVDWLGWRNMRAAIASVVEVPLVEGRYSALLPLAEGTS